MILMYTEVTHTGKQTVILTKVCTLPVTETIVIEVHVNHGVTACVVVGRGDHRDLPRYARSMSGWRVDIPVSVYDTARLVYKDSLRSR